MVYNTKKLVQLVFYCLQLVYPLGHPMIPCSISQGIVAISVCMCDMEESTFLNMKKI